MTTWTDLRRPLPQWYRATPFGIFVHWGAYAVPAWAEPIGALGTFPDDVWFAHNPYAEWYWNTIRIEGSPAALRHQELYGGAPYDDFLDAWTAERFDPGAMCRLFAEAGAGYVVPTTKHHDGITLWQAPETGTRNTVDRGPRQDLVAGFAAGARASGLRLGLYYSGGLDWFVRPMPPHQTNDSVGGESGRPQDAEYGAYCARHVRDLVERYQPDIFWNDINWPDEAKDFSPDGLGTLVADFYAARPEGVVNDRFGGVHHDYRTSEYESGREAESEGAWEQCRGLGWSFGYNQAETAEHYLSGPQAARLLTDVVSRGGHLLLNVGPKADGTLPELQQQALETMAAWVPQAKPFLYGERRPVSHEVTAAEGTWVRVVASPEGEAAFVDRADDATDALVHIDGRAHPVRLDPSRPGPVVVAL
ncbi:MAG: alpha-L-fucosidase [Actinomycetia bacterium]|nr:alpha-L-fucosidase [Actinomycetes bacterium]